MNEESESIKLYQKTICVLKQMKVIEVRETLLAQRKF